MLLECQQDLLVNRMNEAAKKEGIDVHIEAHPVSSVASFWGCGR